MAQTSAPPASDESISYPPATRRRVLVAAIIAAGLVFLDTTVTNVALPAIQRDLGLSTAQQQWVASSYLLTLSVLLLTGGRLADLFGRKRMFLIGVGAYAIVALTAATALNGTILIVARGVQGVAGAMLVPTTLALINATYPPSERGRAIGTWAAWSGIATLLGPALAGFVIDHASWRYALLITPVLAVVAFAIGWGMPESRDESASRAIDYLGIGLVTLALGGLIFPLIQGPLVGWASPEVWLTATVGAVVLALFIVHEARSTNAMLPFGMFADRNLAVANVVTLFVYAGLYGTFFYVTLYVQSSLHASATLAGSLFIPNTILLFFLSPYSGRLNDRYGPRWLLTFGPLTCAAGLVVISFTGPGQILTVMIPGILLFGVGLGFTVTPVTATAIGSAEARYSGVASGFNNAVSRVAGLIAIALMGAIVVQLWHADLVAAVSGASPQVAAVLTPLATKAFVTPNTTGLSPADAAQATARALTAAQASFRNGVLLAAALVAIGGVVGGIWIRPRRADGGGSAS
jgi:EmrB/QacA subfamily drug resistance transporter